MAEIKFYMDEHVPAAVTAGLRKRGVNVLTAQGAGMVEATDKEHLIWATNQGRVIFTEINKLRLEMGEEVTSKHHSDRSDHR